MKIRQYVLISLFLIPILSPNPFDYVEDHKDVEEYDIPTIIDYQNFNYRSIERNVFFEKLNSFNVKVKEYYTQNLVRILMDKTLDQNEAGQKISELFGVDFEDYLLDIKEMEIKIKAFVEGDIDLFFLAECSDRYFHHKQNFEKCAKLQTKIRYFMVFENFYDKGWENGVNMIINQLEIDEEFVPILLRKLQELKFLFKLPLNRIEFQKENIMNQYVRGIEKKLGKGLRIEILMTEDENKEEEANASASQKKFNIDEEVNDKLSNDTPEEFKVQIKQTMEELLNSEFNVDKKGNFIKNMKQDKWYKK